MAPDNFDLFLMDPGPKTYYILIAICDLGGIDLAQAKTILHSPGSLVVGNISPERAEAALWRLTAAGAKVNLQPAKQKTQGEQQPND